MFAEKKTNEKLEFTTFCHLILKNVFQWFINELSPIVKYNLKSLNCSII